jgi:hypothetical protein
LKRFADKRSLLFWTSFIVTLAVITCALVLGWLSPRSAGIAYVLSCLVAIAALTIILERNLKDRQTVEVAPDNPMDAAAREDIKRKIRHYKIIIVVLPSILTYGLYETRGGPLLPRLTGAAMNLLFTFAFILVLRVQQGKLKR